MPFCLDTSAILDAWVRYYPPDVFPTIWEKMDQAASAGQIWLVDEVFKELKRKDDGIYQWVKGRGDIVIPIDEQIQKHLVEIMKKYPRLVDTREIGPVVIPG